VSPERIAEIRRLSALLVHTTNPYLREGVEELLEEVERLKRLLEAPEIDPDEVDRERASKPRRFTHVLRGRLEPVIERLPDPRGDDDWIGEDPSEWTLNASPGAREREQLAELEAEVRLLRLEVAQRGQAVRALRLELQGHREGSP